MRKMLFFSYLLWSSSLCAGSVYAGAAQVHVLRSEKRIEAALSLKDINRIQVEGDRIVAVYGGSEHFTLEADEVGGMIFLKGQEEALSKPIYLTLITENHVTQDLKLTPRDLEAQTILLRLSQAPSDPHLHAVPQAYTQKLLSLVKDLALGLGLSEQLGETGEGKRPSLPDSLKLLSSRLIQTDSLQARAFEVVNLSAQPLSLSYSDFREFQPLAISIEHPSLLPQGRTFIYVISKKERSYES